ncbi:MAG TPA: UTP--glucose-1-phosphate uridylyltransferase, partial [Gemmatimonadaceae bacterium]|nr:UTP--glucose-1-phosphate uridylyltransferase [Gemmatimonadaceae bacterium]
AVDEAIAAGIDEMIFVTHRTKRAIEDHFDRAAELERELEKGGKESALAELRRVAPPHVRFSFARQTAPLGLGHAVWCARHLIGDEPFAVMLPDDLLDGEPPVLAQMVETFQRSGASVIAVENVQREDTSRYGIVEPALDSTSRLTRILGIVEKPQPEKAPSTMGVVGRYVFSPRLLDCLENLEPGSGNEIQLTDGIARLLAQEPVFAYNYIGKRYDCGSKLGFLEATVDFALKHPQLGAEFQQLVNRVADASLHDTAAAGGQGTRGPRHLTLVSS